MNTEALVNAVAAEVLAQLQAMGVTNRPARKSVLLLGNHLDQGWWVNKLGDTFEVFQTPSDASTGVSHFDCVLITQLSNALLDDLFQSVGSSQESSVIIEHLLRGKGVFLLAEGIEYRQFEGTTAPSLFQRFREKEQAVIGYGVTVVTAANTVSVMKGCNASSLQPVTKHVDMNDLTSMSARTEACVIQERVVRESHLLEGIEKGFDRFLIRSDALVTPLAQDCIRFSELNIDKSLEAPSVVD